MSVSRRDLLKAAAATAVSVTLPAKLLADSAEKMPKRKLGKTGWEASIYALGSAEMPGADEAIKAVNALIDGGVNYFDTAPSYMGTQSERILGRVLKDRRKEVFLATKTLQRSADGAYAEIKESLERLQSKQIDTLQIHAINDFGTLDQVLAETGAVKGLEKAKKEGLIRFIGVTGHTRPEVISKALDRYPFDSILIPVSALDASLNDFATDVVPRANNLGIAIIGMKSLKGIERATGAKFEPEEFVRYAWSLPISTLTIGLRQGKEVAQNLGYALKHKKMSADQMRALEKKVAQHADAGNLWWKRK